jgi:DNA repair exonuclease SbcCD nuclease subunit
MKFLHISDVHLGCTRYQLPESPRDFFDAWMDVLRRYGIGENVDFVVMCGDFFHKRSVPPETMNYAVEGLTMMREAGIPVVSIEGNHDQKHNDSEFSWLRSLAAWGLVILLEPTTKDGVTSYSAWDAETKRGGYVDIGRARIFGSDWYGASGNWAIPLLIEAIRTTRRDDGFNMLLLHTDVEGHQTHPIPALSVAALKELKSVVDYVGLGHTHIHYEIDNWAFNPGSIEVTNISEFRESRGALVVEVDDANNVTARHVEDYHYRPFQQLRFAVDGIAEPAAVTAGVLETAANEARSAEPDKPEPIIEITLFGQLGFPNSMIEMQKIRDGVQKATGALHVRLKNQTNPAEMIESRETPDEGRDALERRIISNLVAHDSRYKKKAADIAEAVIGAKRMALSDDEPERIAEFIALKAEGEEAAAAA